MLARVSGLRVAARTSSFAYKGRAVDVRQIARELGVEAVIEGSVRSALVRVSGFQPFAQRHGLMDYWLKHGPPDGCEIRDGQLFFA